MSISLYDLSVGTYTQIVEAATGFLQKGAEHCREKGLDPAELVDARLYPDMANFHFQVVCITHHSLGAIRSLESGAFSPPSYPEVDYAGLQKMTATTLETLRGLDRAKVDALGGGQVVFRMGKMELPFTAENFIRTFSLPNFFFHATTAYDLLRSKGVSIGKIDFLGKMAIGVQS